MTEPFELDPRKIRDISPEVLDEDGRLKVLPAAYWATTTKQERALLGHLNGIYSFPTTELVEYLQQVIGPRKAIEIGAGHGVLADALGITGTDNMHQTKSASTRLYYAAMGQPPVKYGPNVVEVDAHTAVRRYRPQVVIGCWVTHLYEAVRHDAGGNMFGVDEEDVLDNCRSYVFIGNWLIHSPKKIWSRPHSIEYPPWLYSRATNETKEFIATWRGKPRRK